MQTAEWIMRAGPFIERCHERYGDLFTIQLVSSGSVVFASDPTLVKRVFTGDADVLRAGEASAFLEPLIGSRSLLRLDGAEHLRERRLLLPPFHGQRMAAYRETIEQVTRREIDSWPLNEPFELHARFQAITLEVILRAVFGYDDAAQVRDVGDRLVSLITHGTRPSNLIVQMIGGIRRPRRGTTLGDALHDVDEALYDQIARRRRDPDLEQREDILSLMLLARFDDGEGLSDVALRDELITMLLAGHETTATTLAWAFERLLRHDEQLERLTAEARDGDDDDYAAAVVQETLRVRPPIWLVARRLAQPFAVGGHVLPEGAIIAPCIYLTHLREDLYPRAREFRPERFLDEAPETYSWLPFGGGVRRCIGASFATMEMKVVLHEVLRRCRLRADRPEPEPTRRRAVVFAPGRNARVVLTARAPR